jgi:fibronectin-binding autotransporter adhesin
VGGAGGIYNDGTLTLVGSTISKNFTYYGGGGIVNSGSLTLINTTVSDNFAVDGNGGGIGSDGTLTLINSTVSGNLAFYGAGIFEHSGTLTVANSNISDNTTYMGGGGGVVYNLGGTATVTNSTIAGNSANLSGGGGIYNDGGTFTVTDSTIAGNSATHIGGGIYNGGILTAKNTLLANNVIYSGTANCDLDNGTATSLGYNISDDDTCITSFTAIGDENNVIPGAGLDTKGLQNNGGPTQTIALLPGSPAVDHIPVADCTDANGNRVKTDQRGIKRPRGAACDVGAFELVQTVPFSNFTALLAIQTGHNPGFGLTAWFTLGIRERWLCSTHPTGHVADCELLRRYSGWILPSALEQPISTIHI